MRWIADVEQSHRRPSARLKSERKAVEAMSACVRSCQMRKRSYGDNALNFSDEHFSNLP